MVIDGKEIPVPVPVYIESSATDVRLHDLPEEIDTKTIMEHLSQYGEVISIRDELWKNFWPGFSNGVTVVRMKLARHIPSYINFADFHESSTSVSYPSQIRTCMRCNRKAHPKQRCSEAAAAENQTSLNKQTITTAPTEAALEQSFPALPSTSTPVPERTTKDAANAKKQPNNSTKSTRVKRQHTVESDTANKKPSGSDSRPLSEHSLDRQAIYDEYVQNNAYTHFTDPAHRKEMLWYFAGRDVEHNILRLEQQKQQQQELPQ